MAANKKRQRGRDAIDALKAAYMAGSPMMSLADIRAFLITSLQMKAAHIREAASWDRQARLELADENVYVTQPVSANQYARNPNATAEEREVSDRVVVKGVATRTKNASRMADAAAAQPDATRAEIERAVELKVAVRLLEALNVG